MRNIAVIFANVTFTVFFVTSLSLLVLLFINNGPSLTVNRTVIHLILLVTITFCFYGLKSHENRRINLSLVMVSLFLAVYLTEILLPFYPHKGIMKYRISRAKELGREFDERGRFHVVDTLNKQGMNVTFPLSPKYIITHNGLSGKNGNNIFPLAGASGTKTILGNESGFWPIIRNDEHGFNNPQGIYNENDIDITLIGDSFAYGYSVNEGEDIAGQLRKYGWMALNFGIAHNGPLLELAMFKEYVVALKPKYVLWLYFDGNDLSDLEFEMTSSLLMGYLNKNFTQDLINRQNEIDEAIISSCKKYTKPFVYRQKKVSAKRTFFNFKIDLPTI